MDEQAIKKIISESLVNADIQLEGDGCHFTLRVVSSDFQDKSRVQRQQLIYRLFETQIADGTLHALSIKAFTPDEWAKQQ